MKLALLILVLWSAAAAAAYGQGTIVMKAAARVGPDAPVTLADVASLVGPDAEALGAMVIVPAGERSGGGRERIDAERVRAALNLWSGAPPVNWGRLTLGGGTCSILPPLATPPKPKEGASPAAAVPDRGTVRSVIAERLGPMLGVESSDLRLEFDAADADVLGLSIAGRTIDVRPTGVSERMPLAVTVYETAAGHAPTIVAARTLRVGVKVRRLVILASAAKRRGELIGPGDVTTETRWIPPGEQALTLDRVVGAAIRTRLAPGQEVSARDIEPPLVVGRGEVVSVHCVSGQVVVRTTARALDDARDGGLVKLQSLVDESRTFYGRMDGRGRAIAVNATGGALMENKR